MTEPPTVTPCPMCGKDCKFTEAEYVYWPAGTATVPDWVCPPCAKEARAWWAAQNG